MAGIYKVTAKALTTDEALDLEHVGWASSEGAARAKRTEMCAEYALSSKVCSIQKLDVPTKKDELIAWLNTHASLLAA